MSIPFLPGYHFDLSHISVFQEIVISPRAYSLDWINIIFQGWHILKFLSRFIGQRLSRSSNALVQDCILLVDRKLAPTCPPANQLCLEYKHRKDLQLCPSYSLVLCYRNFIAPLPNVQFTNIFYYAHCFYLPELNPHPSRDIDLCIPGLLEFSVYAMMIFNF